MQLNRLGHRVDLATDGAEAIELCTSRSYDLVLMDCQMPRVDGYQATEEIRRKEAGRRRTPIVAITARALSGDRTRCLEAGMDAYATKPLTVESLDRIVRRWTTTSELVTDTEMRPIAPSAPPPPTDEPATERSFDLDGLRRLTAHDPSLMPGLIALFVRQTDERIEALRAAADSKDLERLERQAHALKGSAGTFGAHRLSQVAARVEARATVADADGAHDAIEEVAAEFSRVRDDLAETEIRP